MSTTKQECDAPVIEPAESEEQATTKVPVIGKMEVPFKRTLQCDLTESQLVEVAQEICKTQREIDDLTESKRASAASYAERIKSRTEERDDLMMKFSSRSEDRVVDCVWKLNTPEPGMKTAYRLDTGAAIGAKAMTTEDRDQDLPGIVEPEAKPSEEAEIIEDAIPEGEDETVSAEEAGAVEDDFPEDGEESSEDARVDAIIDGLKDDEKDEPEGDF